VNLTSKVNCDLLGQQPILYSTDLIQFLSEYENEKFEVPTISYADTLSLPDYVKTLSNFDISYTKDIFVNIQVGFPIKEKFAAKF